MDQCERCQLEGMDDCENCYLTAQGEDNEVEVVPSYDLLADRLRSLIDRWDKFSQEHANDDPYVTSPQYLQDVCVLGLLGEILDDYTKTILNEVKRRQVIRTGLTIVPDKHPDSNLGIRIE